MSSGRWGFGPRRHTTAPVATLVAALLALLFIGVNLAHAQSSRPGPAVVDEFENQQIGHVKKPDAAGSHSLLNPGAGAVDSGLDVRRVALSLAIVLGLVFAIRWTMRWIFPTASVARNSHVMKVLSRSVIAPKQQLLLVQVGRRLVVVGDCGTQMNALAEITDPDEVASLLGQLQSEPPERETRSRFAPILGSAQQQFEDMPEPGEPSEAEPAELNDTKNELSGLTEKIRLLSQHLKKAQ